MMRALLAALALAVLATACAHDRPPSGSTMHDGGLAVPPPGWIELCKRNPTDAGC